MAQEKGVQCDICEKTCKSKRGLNRHKTMKHKPSDKDSKTSTTTSRSCLSKSVAVAFSLFVILGMGGKAAFQLSGMVSAMLYAVRSEDELPEVQFRSARFLVEFTGSELL